MLRSVCASCRATVPLGEMFRHEERTLCRACAEKVGSGEPSAEQGGPTLVRLRDPTVCAECGRDGGDVEMPRLANVPLCDECSSRYRHYPFPAWVKVFFAAILALAAVELTRNWRFFQAWFELSQARKSFARRDVDLTASLLASASRHAPEEPEIGSQATIVQALSHIAHGHPREAIPLLETVRENRFGKEAEGIQFQLDLARVLVWIDEGKPAEAAELIRDMKRRAPEGRGLEDLLARAEIDVAWNAKDYDAVLARARLWAETAETERRAMAWGTVASALACKFATTGEEKYRQETLDALKKARELAGTDKQAIAAYEEYEERILFRLRTREIIDVKEYNRRYRNAEKGGTTG